jgi:hypothetical protein
MAAAPVVMMWMTAASAAVTAGAMYKQGRDQASIAERNAAVSNAAATDAINRGLNEEEQVRRKGYRIAGSQRSGMAASGIDIGSGSAVNLQADTAAMTELDALTTRSNSIREAWGLTQQAAIQKFEGQSALSAAKWRAGSSLLEGAMDAYPYYKESKASKKP